ncbi:putative LRR receptor-like serine/threonine-protein kinase [Senna tora]|uniref:Putative LRR receptor-like serine/threonine-protein kinase n=1 Tax=Senna tora TaxID=362788 RepID=A0A834XAY2_9FABA|nr:putative LRR receptor-like serine/threonine-protein kinase [Senna tora]
MGDHRRRIVSFGFLFLLLFQFTFQQIEPLSSPIERAALLQLRSSLSLRSREWPLKADPCLIWNGVSCDENGRVIGINVSGFRRTRRGNQNPQFSIDALANFTLLQSFNASKFSLPGPIPHWFGRKLSSLRVLDLRSCSINGGIPSSIGNLTSLTGLYLSDNNLTGMIPSSISQLLGLSVLDLSQNSLTGPLPSSSSFAFLGNLSFLDLSSNYLSGSIPHGIGALSKLQYLNLSYNSLTSSIPTQLGALSSLVDLDLSGNSLSGFVPPNLMGLRTLQRMMLGNNILEGHLPGNFPAWSQLRFVVLRQNNFSGALPDKLWSLPRLSFLDVSGNNFTGVLPNSSSTVNANTALELNISHNLFYGGITPLLERFSFIDMSSNYLKGKVDFVLNASLDSNCLQNVSNQRTRVECVSFYSERGLAFDDFGRVNLTRPPAEESSGKSNGRKFILAVGLGVGGLISLLMLLLVWLLWRNRKRVNSNKKGVTVGNVVTRGGPPPPDVSINFAKVGDSFTYQQLLKAAGDFSDANLIKRGHTGDLFNGVLESGIPVVIKRVDMRSTKNENAYISELDFFSKVSHPRMVPLLGHCLENENEKFLVYKHMPNGDLLNCLNDRRTISEDGTVQSLDWITRLKIATGTAEALSYLHHECYPPLVHRDIQASSILLDDKYEVRLGSLSEACTQEGDTHQSRITRLLRLQQSSDQGTSGPSSSSVCASDVYCFGKVLLEMITGKLGISASGDAEVKEWLEQTLPSISIYDKDLMMKIVDPTMVVDEDFFDEVWAMAIVAKSCLNPKPSRRPQMKYVLKALENPLKVIREESYSSARLRTTSSRGSWHASLFGSWRMSSSDVTVNPAASGIRVEEGDFSSSRWRHSKEIFPEPSSSSIHES